MMSKPAVICIVAAVCVNARAETLLRYESFLIFKADVGEVATIVVESVPKGKFVYSDEPRVTILDPASCPVEDTPFPLGQKRTFQYRAETAGLHAVCIASGKNLARARVEGRPWAIVTREEAPLYVSGASDAWYFVPPEGLSKFNIFVHAAVTGEAAIVKITDPDGQVVLTKEDDFDRAARLTLKATAQTQGRPWRLDILNPGKPRFALDDVTLWLGPNLQPLLCLKPEWLETFKGVTSKPPEKISHRVLVSEQSLRLTKSTPQTVRFNLADIPEAKIVALRVRATDIDYRTESPAVINGAKYFLPVTGDGITADVTLELRRDTLRVGGNVIDLAQDPTGGSGVYSIRRMELLFGEAINFE